MWPLDDWVATVKTARSHILSLKDSFQGQIVPTSIGQGDNAIQLHLFRQMHSLWNQKAAVKILLNMQIAAMHLSYMLNPGDTRLVGSHFLSWIVY
jgi:hypothetical protein